MKKEQKFWQISQWLKNKSEEDFGHCKFAFANFKCGCGEGLAIFQVGTHKLLILLHNPEADLQKIYQEALEKSASCIPEIKTALEILNEVQNEHRSS